MTCTAHGAPGRRGVVHFWPSDVDFGLQEGARLPCGGVRPSPAITSARQDRVTCGRCRVTRVFQSALFYGWSEPVLWSRAELVEAGLLAADAPPPVQPEPPYRNPNLTARDPLGALIELWERTADGVLAPVGGITSDARHAIGQCANELRSVLDTLRKGGW